MPRRVVAYPAVLAIAALAAFGASALGLAGADWYIAGVAALVVTVATVLVWSEQLRFAVPRFRHPLSIHVESSRLAARYSMAHDADTLLLYQHALADVTHLAAEAIKEQADTSRVFNQMLATMQALLEHTPSSRSARAHVAVGSAIATETDFKIGHVVGAEPMLRVHSQTEPWTDDQTLADLIRSSLDLHIASDFKVYVYTTGDLHVFVATDIELTVEQHAAMPVFTSVLDVFHVASTALLDARENADR